MVHIRNVPQLCKIGVRGLELGLNLRLVDFSRHCHGYCARRDYGGHVVFDLVILQYPGNATDLLNPKNFWLGLAGSGLHELVGVLHQALPCFDFHFLCLSGRN